LLTGTRAKDAGYEFLILHTSARWAVLPVIDHAVIVIHGDPHVPCDDVISRERFLSYLGERHDEVIAAHMKLVLAEPADSVVRVAVIRLVDLKSRSLAPNEGHGWADSWEISVFGQPAMEYRCMGGVQSALHGLKPIALFISLVDVALILWCLGPGERRERRLLAGRPHERPEEAAHLSGGIGLVFDFVTEVSVIGLVHLVDALARVVELPSVVDTAKTVLLVASEPERCTPVGAVLEHEADTPRGVAEGNEFFAKQANTERRAVRFNFP
jgi:hypothetical protein